MTPAVFKLLIILEEGMPYFASLKFDHRSQAIKRGTDIIDSGGAKAIVVYRNKKPTQLLVYRPKVYVHIERI